MKIMKKLIFLFTICLALFTSCQKSDELTPEKEYLTVEVWINQVDNQPENLSFTLSGQNVNYSEQKTITGSGICFKSTYYIDLNNPIYLNVEKSGNSVLSVYSYTKPGNKSFKIIESNTVEIKVIENAFKNVILTEI